MTKREEIITFLKDGLGNVWADGRDGKYINLDDCVESIIKHLRSQGLVIKVKRKLPRDICQDVIDRIGTTREDAGSYKRSQQDMLKADYVAVEPLIGVTRGAK